MEANQQTRPPPANCKPLKHNERPSGPLFFPITRALSTHPINQRSEPPGPIPHRHTLTNILARQLLKRLFFARECLQQWEETLRGLNWGCIPAAGLAGLWFGTCLRLDEWEGEGVGEGVSRWLAADGRGKSSSWGA